MKIKMSRFAELFYARKRQRMEENQKAHNLEQNQSLSRDAYATQKPAQTQKATNVEPVEVLPADEHSASVDYVQIRAELSEHKADLEPWKNTYRQKATGSFKQFVCQVLDIGDSEKPKMDTYASEYTRILAKYDLDPNPAQAQDFAWRLAAGHRAQSSFLFLNDQQATWNAFEPEMAGRVGPNNKPTNRAVSPGRFEVHKEQAILEITHEIQKAGAVGEAVVDWAKMQQNNMDPTTNPNNGEKGPMAWDLWCFSFVRHAWKGAVQQPDLAVDLPGWLAPGSAIESYEEAKNDPSFVSKDDPQGRKNIPEGAILYFGTTNSNPYGHAAIATGKCDAKGVPLVITSGWDGFDGISEITLDEMERVYARDANGELKKLKDPRREYLGYAYPKCSELSG